MPLVHSQRNFLSIKQSDFATTSRTSRENWQPERGFDRFTLVHGLLRLTPNTCHRAPEKPAGGEGDSWPTRHPKRCASAIASRRSIEHVARGHLRRKGGERGVDLECAYEPRVHVRNLTRLRGQRRPSFDFVLRGQRRPSFDFVLRGQRRPSFDFVRFRILPIRRDQSRPIRARLSLTSISLT